MVYQRGSQREGSPHYVFLYSDDETSEDEDNIPLQPRKKTASLPRKVEVINVQLKSEDTLQALALRYRCTISEIKRINKIHKENEIHARRFIKIPVQPFSLLTETVEEIQSEQAGSSEVSMSTANEEVISTSIQNPLLNIMKNPVVTQLPKAEINAIILNSVCEPLSSYNNSNSLEIVSAESDQLLTSTDSNSNGTHVTDTFKCSGDDCGLSWTQLLGFSLLLGFAGPIIYILYIAEFSSKNHSTNNH
ncbi:lysM and putative peptidoglycan-binding domain-containing protein 3 [Nomia melanderi]|uniref:lysM and putative peptidoglycan-binding domain-containing protein 3 n=1 Tax=Nomia melanderi TaxID=2448451 RepID=UPI0013044F40|nr:lysM and putative peptidoglycan-binding domain-containing protein 3 [Nomia melanderi]XP_031833504.1 lysM and putative peptidoglycan-binding domain-containing protein 3 [Nomia melanderi]